MFFWVTENVFQCKTTDCNITYSRFETLSYLKVNIPNEITDDEYKKLNDTEKNIFDNERTLEACYENYFKTDTSRDEKFECEVCEKESPAIALRLIHTVPDVALISLLRVQEDRSGGSYRTFKNKNAITYPKSISLTSNPDEQHNLQFVGYSFCT